MNSQTTFFHSLHPIREGCDIYVLINGERVKLSPLQASVIARAWFDAVSGAYIAQPFIPPD